jgi:hypothetical protein
MGVSSEFIKDRAFGTEGDDAGRSRRRPWTATGIRAGAELTAMEAGSGSPRIVDLHQVIGGMQEAVLVLASTPGAAGSVDRCYRVEYLNDIAARALDGAVSDCLGRALVQLLPPDTAHLLHQLCEQAWQSRKPVEYFAAAPDPMTDLGGTAFVTVRATRIGCAVLCAWLPDWPGAADNQLRPAGTAASSVADRLELADTLETSVDVGLGLFSLNVTSGRVIWSKGMYGIFGQPFAEGPIDALGMEACIDHLSVPPSTWRALLWEGLPIDMEARLVPRLGSHRLRLTARASLGMDGRPAVVRGQCYLLGA